MNTKPILRIRKELQIRDAMGDILKQLPLSTLVKGRCFFQRFTAVDVKAI